jgi:hypothetical protein
MSEQVETKTKTETTDYKARARRAWETRRANASKRGGSSVVVAAKPARKRVGRPAKVIARGTTKTTISFGGFEVTSAVYSFDQVRELGAAAVTTDGSSYRLLRQNGTIVPASYFERG